MYRDIIIIILITTVVGSSVRNSAYGGDTSALLYIQSTQSQTINLQLPKIQWHSIDPITNKSTPFASFKSEKWIMVLVSDYPSDSLRKLSKSKGWQLLTAGNSIYLVLGFTLLALIWKYDFPPFMVLIIVILNDGTIVTISQDRVKSSPIPDSWKLNEIFATGIAIGTYLALITVLFYWTIVNTDFFEAHFKVKSLFGHSEEITSAVYLQVSIIRQALIFLTRSQSWSFLERPGVLLMCAFVVAQLARFT